MPSRNTFTIPPFRQLLARVLQGRDVIVDPFANQSRLGTIRNDLNPDFDTDYHLDALTFLRQLPPDSADALLYDPPYSITQAAECYHSYGKERLATNVANMGYWRQLKDAAARVIKTGGVCISFGWNSNGLGLTRGFTMDEMLICAHGGSKNDTICTVETKNRYPELLT